MGAKNLLLGHLKVILGNHVESDIVDYIHSIKNKEDLDEFMENIIDKNNSGHVTSYEGICNILFGSNKTSKKSHSETMVTPKGQEKNNKAIKQKGKKRFSDINTYQEKKKQQEGRTICDCEGQVHEFMNNCLNCGRIHCYEEGPGPCFFCSEPVSLVAKLAMSTIFPTTLLTERSFNGEIGISRDFFTFEVLDRRKNDMYCIGAKCLFLPEWFLPSTSLPRVGGKDTLFSLVIQITIVCYIKISDSETENKILFIYNQVTLMGEETYLDLSSSRKNKKSASVTKHKENTVFDDDNDYFKTDSNHAKQDKRTMVVALDFATRRVIESTTEDVRIKEKLHEDIKKHLANVEKLYRKLQKESEVIAVPDNNDLVDLLVQMRHKKPVGVEDLGSEDNKAHIIDYGKVYDEEVIANTDHGLCLSMHQPYASLLVAGVKKHEGRTWKTNHRGRLWIAAAAKEPDEDEICALETFYRHYYNDQSLKFPRDYPTSCLLGCVFVDDCLDQETYRKRFPNGESNSPYVLICSNPIILPIFYPILGKHKIYPLDKELHNCAKLSLRHANYFD